jgi:hypothetical protein
MQMKNKLLMNDTQFDLEQIRSGNMVFSANKPSVLMKVLMMISFTSLSLTSCAQVNFNNLFNSTNSSLGKGLSNETIVKGLKEALSKGAGNSAAKASQVDGFLKNPLIKIPFPTEAKQMESSLRQIGMGKQVDQFVNTLNRAAEDAAKKAAPIFINAITSMSITDGINILRGGNTAATEFLRTGTTQALKANSSRWLKVHSRKLISRNTGVRL